MADAGFQSAQRPVCVLQVLPALNEGGVEQGTLDIAEALIKRGHVALIASSGGRMVATLEKLGARHIQLPLHSKNPVTLWRNAKALERCIQDNHVDIVHARSRAPAWSSYLACQRSNTPFITTFHGAYGHQNSVKRWYNSVMCRGAPIIAVSQFIADHIQQVYGTAPERIGLIPRGVEAERYAPENIDPARILSLKKQWNFAPAANQITLMLPGRLTRIKGHALLLEAMAQASELPLHCLIVGSDHDSPYTRELKTKVAALNLSTRVQFTGHCQDMAAAYQLADVVVSATTKPESFGRTLAEAQAAGKRIIAPKHGASPEVVAPELASGLFEPGSADALTQALRRVCSVKDEQSKQLTAAAQRFVQTHYSLRQMCDKTLAVYQRQIEQREQHEHG